MNKIAYIEWQDSASPPTGWFDPKEYEFTLSNIVTIGFVIEDNDDYITVAQNKDDEGDVDNVISIPVSVITRIEFLEVPEEEEVKPNKESLYEECVGGCALGLQKEIDALAKKKFDEALKVVEREILFGIKPPTTKPDSQPTEVFKYNISGFYKGQKMREIHCNDVREAKRYFDGFKIDNFDIQTTIRNEQDSHDMITILNFLNPCFDKIKPLSTKSGSKIIKTCLNCFHENIMDTVEPCYSCNNYDKWEGRQ